MHVEGINVGISIDGTHVYESEIVIKEFADYLDGVPQYKTIKRFPFIINDNKSYLKAIEKAKIEMQRLLNVSL